MKFCQDCKYFEMGKTTRYCRHPITYDNHPVFGRKWMAATCFQMRLGICGTEGKLYEPMLHARIVETFSKFMEWIRGKAF